MKKTLVLAMSLVMLFSTFSAPVSAAGYIDSSITIDGDLSDYDGQKIFDVEYCYGYNDFENVSNYNPKEYYKIVDTGDSTYKKAIEVPAFKSWLATMAYNQTGGATYTWNGKTYTMLNESVVKDDYYIFSYDYKSDKRTFTGGDNSAFAFAPTYSVYDASGDVARNYAKYYDDEKWHTKSIGFKAEDTTLKMRIHGMNVNTHSYIDNLLVMKAVPVIMNDQTGATVINDLNGNILKADGTDNKSGYPLITCGESAKFTVDAKKGLGYVVKMGGNTLTPDRNGVYTIAKVTGNITVDVTFSGKVISANYYVDNGIVYLPKNTNVYALSERTGFDVSCFKAYRNEKALSADSDILEGDTLKLSSNTETVATYSVKYAGDTDKNGNITVTDVTALINAMLNNTKIDANIADLNGDKILTVSDVVYMRNIILNSDDKVYSADDKKLAISDEYISKTLSQSGSNATVADLEQGIYNYGNRAAVANVMKKAMCGEDVTIAAFGGSITAGSGCGSNANFENTISGSNSYVAWVEKWWKDNFESYGGKVTMIYAGIGATDTPQRIHTMYTDVIDKGADLVITEWACNDSRDLTYKAGTYEAMIRKFLEEDIAVVVFGMDMANKSGSQSLHRPYASYYNIPFVSYLDAFGNNPLWTQFTNDTVHPNKVGHALAGLVLNNYFNNVYKDIANIGPYVADMPTDYIYEFGEYYEGTPYNASLTDIAAGKYDNIRIISTGSFTKEIVDENGNPFKYGFRVYDGAYTANIADTYSPLVIEVDDCRTASILLHKYYTFKDAFFKVTVNGVECTEGADSFTARHSTAQTEGTYQWTTYPIVLSKQPQKVRLEILPTVLSQGTYNSNGVQKQYKDFIRIFSLCLTK